MCLHLFPGFSGLLIGISILILMTVIAYLTRGPGPFNLDPKAEKGAFEPFLQKYIRAAELVIGLASTSIVLLIGASTLHSKTGQLPWFYASPLLLLAMSVAYALTFIVWLILEYEEYSHGNKHTRLRYSISLASGFSAFFCFAIAYVWLVYWVTR
jgi:lysylphosphatidylglycerol synthetase-like protein (DUF2156 family)